MDGQAYVRDLERRVAKLSVADSEVPKLLEPLTCGRSEMNTSAPVDSLPPEILSKIFLEARQDPDPWPVVHISHTCQFWRSVALNLPPLWSCIPITNPSMTSAFIQRANNTPLTLQYTPSRYPTNEPDVQVDEELQGILSTIRPHVGRILSVDIQLGLCDTANAFCELLEQESWPNLEFLRIILECECTPNPTVHLFNNLLLRRETILRVEPQNLRYLELYGIDLVPPGRITWHNTDLNSFSHFRFLSLHDVSIKTFGILMMVLVLLELCPGLEHFCLQTSDIYHRDSEPALPELESRMMVRLPSMQSLRLVMPWWSDLNYLLARLAIPESAQVFLDTDGHGHYHEANPLSCAYLLRSINPTQRYLDTASCIRICRNGLESITLSAYRGDPADDAPPCMQLQTRFFINVDVTPWGHTTLYNGGVAWRSSGLKILELEFSMWHLRDMPLNTLATILSNTPHLTIFRQRHSPLRHTTGDPDYAPPISRLYELDFTKWHIPFLEALVVLPHTSVPALVPDLCTLEFDDLDQVTLSDELSEAMRQCLDTRRAVVPSFHILISGSPWTYEARA